MFSLISSSPGVLGDGSCISVEIKVLRFFIVFLLLLVLLYFRLWVISCPTRLCNFCLFPPSSPNVDFFLYQNSWLKEILLKGALLVFECTKSWSCVNKRWFFFHLLCRSSWAMFSSKDLNWSSVLLHIYGLSQWSSSIYLLLLFIRTNAV